MDSSRHQGRQALGLAALLACAGCRTWEHVQTLPDGYWTATWLIFESFVLDIVDLVKLLL